MAWRYVAVTMEVLSRIARLTKQSKTLNYSPDAYVSDWWHSMYFSVAPHTADQSQSPVNRLHRCQKIDGCERKHTVTWISRSKIFLRALKNWRIVSLVYCARPETKLTKNVTKQKTKERLFDILSVHAFVKLFVVCDDHAIINSLQLNYSLLRMS